MSDLERRPVALAGEERRALERALAAGLPGFAPRVSEGRVFEVEEIAQPWFRHHRILEVRSPVPPPERQIHVAFDAEGACSVLTASLESFNAMSRRDSPPRLEEPDGALRYANLADWWTTESTLGELLISTFDEIPWHRSLPPKEAERVERLRGQVADLIQPLRIERRGEDWFVEKWLVSAARLIRRELSVSQGGQVNRHDRIVAEDLPCPRGRLWGFVDGRLVPVG